MAVLERHPSILQGESLQRLEFGLSGSGTKEYSLAPWVVMVQASVPQSMWAGIYFSWISLKGHLQSTHDLEAVYFFASRTEEHILGMWGLSFSNRESMETFLEEGYTVSRMLLSMGIPESDIHVSLHREFS